MLSVVVRVSSCPPVAVSQAVTVLSKPDANRRVPSGLKTTRVTGPDGRTNSCLPLAASHSFAALSAPAVASRVPSGLKTISSN